MVTTDQHPALQSNVTTNQHQSHQGDVHHSMELAGR